MNCAKVEKLLPLYVEGDLDARETDGVRSHLSSCDFCRNLSEEFAVSQAGLRNFAVPEFGAEFYEQIRGAVLKEIGKSPLPARPSIFQTLGRLFPARPALATSLATLALFGALSLTLYLSLVKTATTPVAIDESMAEFNLNVLAEDEVRPVIDAPKGSSAGGGQPGLTAVNNVRRRSVRIAKEPLRPDSSAPQKIDTAGSAIRQTVAEMQGATSDEATGQVVARMDIQTSDPNIRIIWLARKASE